MKNARRFGLPDVALPKVDFRDIAARIKSVIDEIQPHDSEERFCGLGAKVEFGDAQFTDEHSIRINGRTFTAKNWVIATGSSAMVPTIDGLDKAPYITNREIFYLDSLPGSMICIGGGPIAIEMAQAFSRLGTSVTVVEYGKQILGKEDPDMAAAVMRALQAEGVKFVLGAEVSGVMDFGSWSEITVKSAGKSMVTLTADTILVATGRTANAAGLGLESIGVEFDRRGVKVDGRLRTTQKHIYAAGDVTGKYQFTHAAGYEGGVVIANTIFHLPRKIDYTLLPWCTYTDPELASIGMNETAAKQAEIEYTVWTEEFRDNDRSLAEGEHTGLIKMILGADEKPVGVQIFGPHAGELINEWVVSMNGGTRLSTLASAVHPYPTLGEINKKVAGSLLSQKLFSEKVRKGLKFLFHLKGRACGGTE
jgi:pyruvate/2-oxoglutarate dehydrogenase complex dihydrolipoamide dehydrogenase (E3) component